jgi:hypothetical protein
MTQTRHSEFQTKLRQEEAHHGVVIAKDGAGPMAAGRTAYRDEYQRDYGPDLDEPSDRTESGQEFRF